MFKIKMASCGLEQKMGLNRFDGYSFKTFRHDPAVTGSLGSDKVHSLLSDKTAGLMDWDRQGPLSV